MGALRAGPQDGGRRGGDPPPVPARVRGGGARGGSGGAASAAHVRHRGCGADGRRAGGRDGGDRAPRDATGLPLHRHEVRACGAARGRAARAADLPAGPVRERAPAARGLGCGGPHERAGHAHRARRGVRGR